MKDFIGAIRNLFCPVLRRAAAKGLDVTDSASAESMLRETTCMRRTPLAKPSERFPARCFLVPRHTLDGDKAVSRTWVNFLLLTGRSAPSLVDNFHLQSNDVAFVDAAGLVRFSRVITPLVPSAASAASSHYQNPTTPTIDDRS